MQPFPCDVCGQPATIHETALEAGPAVVHHYCAEHGRSAWPDALRLDGPHAQAEALKAAEEYFRNLSDEEKAQLAELHRFTQRRG
jgi:hypothetical protein